MEDARKNSVRNLQTLYGAVVALALATGLQTVIGAGGQAASVIQWQHLALLIAFVATLIPFYHGALRHLDQTYIERGGRGLRSGALLGDFIILFVEGCVFLALAQLLTNPTSFGWGLLLLLGIDVIWGTIAHFEFTQEASEKTEWKWVQNNAVTLVILGVFLWIASERLPGETIIGFLLAVTVARTIVDYARSWGFYYPAS